MKEPQLIIALATAMGALGMWLILPRPTNRGRALGVVLGAAGLGLLATQVSGLGHLANDVVFAVMAGVTVLAAVATVTFRSPVYCAIWFGLTLLGTAGLFMFQGAQFLAVATIVVYAGAILVTFLFVLMLAQPEGHTHYDRRSWEPIVSAFTGAVIVGVLAMTVTNVLAAEPPQAPATVRAEDRERGVLDQQHVARIGAELFDRHLIAVEVAGTLLLAALVGAAVIVGQGKGPLAGSKSTENNQVPARQ